MSIKLESNSNILQNHRLKRYMQSMSAEGLSVKQDKTVFKEQLKNNVINTTTELKNSSRVSFTGAPTTWAEKLVKFKWFEKFCVLAKENSAVAEAVGALIITCGMRPLTILAMPEKDEDKNRKAASHSVASGLTGLVFAKIAYEPFSLATKKIKAAVDAGNGAKYLGDAVDFYKQIVPKTAKKSTNWDCFNQLATYGPKVLTASILAAFTIGTMPYIDKYIIDKYILKKKPKKDEKPAFTTYDHFKYVTFKSTQSGKNVFQDFKGALK